MEITKIQEALKDTCLTRQEYKRALALLLTKKKFPRAEICEIVGISLSSLEDWVTLYNQKGLQGLRNTPHENNNAKLKKGQKEAIKEYISSHTPKEANVGNEAFWSILTLKTYVKRKYAVMYTSDESYRLLLHFCGMSYQRVEFEEKRKDAKKGDAFKHEYHFKTKKGGIVMSW